VSVLIPMSPESYARFLETTIPSYAEVNVAVGRWPAEGALERSRADHEKMLPLGLATPDNYLFDIHDAAAQTVGSLWVAMLDRSGVRTAFIYNVEIDAPYRRQGHAKRAFTALEPIARELGTNTIGLHVFAYNTAAQALYESLGYRVTGLNMQKRLGDQAG
jgi:ribosomal protein S18 acetylase RimI-like enzyme